MSKAWTIGIASALLLATAGCPPQAVDTTDSAPPTDGSASRLLTRVGADPDFAAELGLAAADVRGFEQASSATFFRLHPVPAGVLDDTDPMRDLSVFHGFPVLKQVQLSGDAMRTTLSTLFDPMAVGSADGFAKCFLPRHAVSAIVSGKRYDAVVCFECTRANIFVDGVQVGATTVNEPGKVRADAAFSF